MTVIAAASNAGAAVAGIFVLLVWLGVIVVCAMKGKPWFAVLGLLWGIFAIIGAIRLAKPNSWWDRHRYGEAKHQRAVDRFTYHAPTSGPGVTRAGF